MRLPVTVEPVVFAYVFALAMASPLLQQYIYKELSNLHNLSGRDDSKLCDNGSSISNNITRLENMVQTAASHWFIALSLSCKYIIHCTSVIIIMSYNTGG